MAKKVDEICEKVKFIQKHGSEEVDSCLVELIQELYQGVLASCKKLTTKEGNVIRLQKPADLDDPNLYKELTSETPESPQIPSRDHSSFWRRFMPSITVACAVLLATLFMAQNYDGTQTPPAGCSIKGNINTSGERIYHAPQSRWYKITQVDESRGERWFCSEPEAQAAGWRKPHKVKDSNRPLASFPGAT